MWICELPHIRVKSLETDVRTPTYLLRMFQLFHSVIIDMDNCFMQILLRLQHDIYRSRDDLFPPSEPVFASWSCALLGTDVATHR